MSSITTALPTGPIQTWCIQIPYFGVEGLDWRNLQCANSTLGQHESDFETICCDGAIISNSVDIWGSLVNNDTEKLHFPLSDLTCCRGDPFGGVGQVTTCSSGPYMSSTPLASLAATNTANAQPYLITAPSASQGDGTSLGDFIYTNTPYCIWMYTKNITDQLSTVTLPAARITTLTPTDDFGNPITTTSAYSSSVMRTTVTKASSSSSDESHVTTTTSSAPQSSAPTSSPSPVISSHSSSARGGAQRASSALKIALIALFAPTVLLV